MKLRMAKYILDRTAFVYECYCDGRWTEQFSRKDIGGPWT